MEQEQYQTARERRPSNGWSRALTVTTLVFALVGYAIAPVMPAAFAQEEPATDEEAPPEDEAPVEPENSGFVPPGFVGEPLTAEEQAIAAGDPFRWRIMPPGSADQCLDYGVLGIQNPHSASSKYLYFPTLDTCSDVSALMITTSTGRPFLGANGVVSIRLRGTQRCLTNPGDFNPHYVGIPAGDWFAPGGNGSLTWEDCDPDTSNTSAQRLRQLFEITSNANGFVRIASYLQSYLNVPNPQVECLTQNGPHTLIRAKVCDVNNWTLALQ